MKKNILITGGAGYVGLELIENLLKKNFKVICYDNFLYKNISTIKKFKNKNFQYIKSDIRDLKKLSKILPQVNTVIHLAAIVGDLPCKVIPDLSYEINFLSTINLAKLCEKYRVEKFIFASTCSNYGIVNPNTPAKEDNKLNPISLYAETKIDCENYLASLQSDSFHPTCLRYGTAYGVSFRTRFDLLLNSFSYEAFFEKELMVFGANTWRPYIHVADMSQVLLKVLEADENKVGKQIFNAGTTSENYKKKDVVHMIEEALPNIKAHYSNSIDDVRNYKVDFSKIEQTIGFKPTLTVQKGIQELIFCFRTGVLSKTDFENNNLEQLKLFFKGKESTLAK